jgi:hypothetical protein
MKIFIGYDSLQSEASAVCEYSLRKHSSQPLEIHHLDLAVLKQNNDYFRQDSGSTEFAYSRFLVPHLSGFDGWSMFVDSDFLFTHDIHELFKRVEQTASLQDYAVFVCKHPEYTPKNSVKFYGQPQTALPKKNWSSLMLFNNGHPATRRLTKMMVNNATPQYLHRFGWCDLPEIGHFSFMWNWLVGEYDGGEPVPFGIHFTNGGPFNGVHGQDYADIWLRYRDELNSL